MSKLELQDYIKYGRLFEVYGSLLSEDRQKIMTEYFEYNNTLAEIASERNISRQAVLDAIAKACKKLDEFEDKLALLKFKTDLQEALGELKSLLKDDKLKEKVDKILEKF